MLNHCLMPRTGRPKKPEGEKLVGYHVKFSPALIDQLEAEVPARQRAAFIRKAVEEALKRLIRTKKKDGAE